MDDLISRQTAIDAIVDLPNCYNGFSDTYDKAYIIGVLEELPSAQPERKKGKWAKQSPTVDTEECSECGYNILGEEFETPYCPWCGAYMKGDTE